MRKHVQIISAPAAVLLVALCLAGCISVGLAVGHSGRGAEQVKPQVQRYGMVIGLKPDKVELYKELHANVWPDVLKKIHECNIRNYSIYLMKAKENEYYLFSYFEYTGRDFKADMAKMAADPTTQKWWELCKPCQEPLPIRAEGDWWATLGEVFHCE